ncbi:MAG: hypothetical protein NTX28_01600, partial [Novosphingobium sp.]|nr:hypothetical protein [Novosphingobium sp.]
MLKRFDIMQDGFAPTYYRATPVVLGAAAPTRLFGLDLVNSTLAETAETIIAMARGRACATIQFVNAHCINMLRTDAGYADALSRADYLLPDGSGIAIAARLAGQAAGENLNGTDL